MLHNDFFEIFDNLNFRLIMVSSDSLVSLYFQISEFNTLKLLTYSVTSKADYILVPWELFSFMELLNCITAKV